MHEGHKKGQLFAARWLRLLGSAEMTATATRVVHIQVVESLIGQIVYHDLRQ